MRLLIIDGNNRFISCYIKNPSISPDGKPVGGIDGFLKSLNKLLRETKPDKVLICWDSPDNAKKRRRINKNYKLNRKSARLNRFVEEKSAKKNEENRNWQLLSLIGILNYLPVSQVCLTNIEADDIIAFVCNNYKNHDKIIVSSDKDYYQLLDDSTVVMRPTQKEILTKYDVTEKYNIHPNNFPIARAIEGDSSDNLKGVKGLGIKTVSKLFTRLKNEDFFELKDVFKICEEKVKNEKNCGKSIHKILENKELIEENYVLMQLQVTRISVQNQNVIHSIVEHNDSDFNQIFFLSELINCGLGKNNEYEELKKNCRILSNKNWEV